MGLPAGHRLGPYEIEAPLGAGGMGEVYRARDVRLDRTVAVKILPPELAVDERYRQRFEREARAASALSHPHIAHVYDVGEQDGMHFIAMEYVEGENLRQLVSRGPLDVDRVVELGAQMASALEEAHARGVVHRDIKSANAVVTPKGQVKVLDFGLARRDRDGAGLLDSEQVTEARTQAGVVVGTVPYMSPEQALGKDARRAHRPLQPGRRPLRAGDGPAALRREHRDPDDRPDLPRHARSSSGRRARTCRRSSSAIVRKCLEKDRDRRYATARDLAGGPAEPAARPGLGHGPGGARAAPREPAPARPARGGRVLVVLSPWGRCVLFRAGTRGGASIGSVAVLPFENATGDPAIEYLSDGISESLINKLSSLPGLRVISRTSAFAFKGKKLDPTEIGRTLGVDALLLGSLAQRGASLAITAELVSVRDDTQLWGEKYSRRADDVLQVEGEIAATIARTLRRQLSGEEKAEARPRRRPTTPRPIACTSRGATSSWATSRRWTRASTTSSRRWRGRRTTRWPTPASRRPTPARPSSAGAAGRSRRQGPRRREPRARARSGPRRGPRRARPRPLLLRVGLGGRGDRVPSRARAQPGQPRRPGGVRVVPDRHGPPRRGARAEPEGGRARPAVDRPRPRHRDQLHGPGRPRAGRHELPPRDRHRPQLDLGLRQAGPDPGPPEEVPRGARPGRDRREEDRGRRRAAVARRGSASPTRSAGRPRAPARSSTSSTPWQRSNTSTRSTFADVHSALGEVDEALRWYEKAFEDRTPNMAYASIVPLISPGLAGNPRYEAIVRRMAFPQPGS